MNKMTKAIGKKVTTKKLVSRYVFYLFISLKSTICTQ